jgi:long-chain acyl-CoA synthetase
VVVGDRRPYLVAVVTLDPEEVATYARDRGLPPDGAALAANADIRESIEAHVEKINEKYARVEQVKRFAILERDLAQETGELTPTMKIKRRVVDESFKDTIDALYSA